MGTFIKRYDINFKFQYSKSFKDKDGDIVFATGVTEDGVPLIVKTDISGNFLWGKRYSIGGSTENGIEKIIQINFNTYLVYIERDMCYHVFMIIDADGNIMIHNNSKLIKYTYKNPVSQIFILPMFETSFAIVESAKGFDNFFHPHFGVFDVNFNFQYGHTIDEPIFINCVDTIAQGLTLVGRAQDNNNYILFFDKSRFDTGKYNRMLKLHNDMAGVWEIYDVKIIKYDIDEVEVLISGKRPSIPGVNEALFLSRLRMNLVSTDDYSADLNIFPDSSNDYSSLCEVSYLTQYNKQTQKFILHRLVLGEYPNFQVLWSKSIDMSQYTRLNDIIHRVSCNDNLLVANINGESVLIGTNQNFESNLTINLQKTSLMWGGEFIIHTSSFCMDSYLMNLYDGIQVTTSIVDPGDTPIIPEIPITPNTILQSQQVGIMAAGSLGSSGDGSTAGIHLRWTFGGELGKKHLPKGNYALTNSNFNKNDYPQSDL